MKTGNTEMHQTARLTILITGIAISIIAIALSLSLPTPTKNTENKISTIETCRAELTATQTKCLKSLEGERAACTELLEAAIHANLAGY